MNTRSQARAICLSILIGLLGASVRHALAQTAATPSTSPDASSLQLRPSMPATGSSGSAGSSAPTTAAPVMTVSPGMNDNTADLSSQGLASNTKTPPPPSMDTIKEKVPVTIAKDSVERGPYVGLTVHLKNGTDAPLVFDGNRARVNASGKQLEVASDEALEKVAAPGPSVWRDTKITVADAVTVGAVSAIRDYRIERGPILARYGTDQMRREVTLERFGARILWPGEETDGIVYVADDAKPDAVTVELPVVTFPQLEIRGYISSTK